MEMQWRRFAACSGDPADLFFSPTHLERKIEKEQREAQACAVCAGCPVREVCLQYALEHAEPHGIWGGQTEAERRQALRGRGLPVAAG